MFDSYSVSKPLVSESGDVTLAAGASTSISNVQDVSLVNVDRLLTAGPYSGKYIKDAGSTTSLILNGDGTATLINTSGVQQRYNVCVLSGTVVTVPLV